MTLRGEWHPVRVRCAGLQSHMDREWLGDPAWDLLAVYAEPDELRHHPHHTLAQQDPDGDYPHRDAVSGIMWNRHIDRRFHIDYPRTTEDAPRVRSRTLNSAAEDWRAIIEHRDRYLADSKLSLSSPQEAIARCFADSFKAHSYFKDKPSCPTFAESPRELSNPIEGLLFKSFCVGCAHAYAAMADASNLQCRTIGCGAHRVAEVCVDGKWHFVENSCRHETAIGLEAFFPDSFMEVTMDPLAFLDHMPAGKAANYWSMPNGQFHFMGGTWMSMPTLRYASSNAYALYPEKKRWGFKTSKAVVPLVLCRGGFYLENIVHSSDQAAAQAFRAKNCPFPVDAETPISDFLYHPWQPNEKIRQSVWLDEIDDMRHLEVILPLAPEAHVTFDAELGQLLDLSVNGHTLSLASWDAWPPAAADNRGHRHCTVKVPTAHLRPHSVNWLVLSNRSPLVFQAPFVPAAKEPYIAPLFRPG